MEFNTLCDLLFINSVFQFASTKIPATELNFKAKYITNLRLSKV